MKSIKLLNLKLVNFKGIKEFELNAEGQDVHVFGKNEAGKTSVTDAFLWLLFGKDSQNKSPGRNGFDIKMLTDDGDVIHHLDAEVEGVFLIDGHKRTFKKIYKEVWQTVTGSVEKELTRHTTDCFVDGTPTIQREYKNEISKIVDEEVFRMITDPAYFNGLAENERRKVLLDVLGGFTDEDVLNSDKAFKPLISELDGRSVDKHQEKIKSERTEVRKRLKLIPELIKENNLNVPEITGLSESKIISEIDKLSLEIEEKKEEINNLRNGSKINEIKVKISDLNLEVSNVKNEHTQNEQQEVYKLEAKLQEEESNYNILKNDIKDKMTEQKRAESNLEQLHIELEQIKSTGQSLSKEEFEGEHTCPTCTQTLPEDQIEQATANFNKNKAEKLEALRAEGNKLISDIEDQKELLENIEKEIEKITANGQEKAKQVEKVKEQLGKAKSIVKPVEENEKYIALLKEIDTFNKEIETLQKSVEESVQKVIATIEPLEQKRSELQADLRKIEQSAEIKDRIANLEDEQKLRASEDEKLTHQLHLIDLFTRKKVSLLENKVSDKFKFARFKLFDQLVGSDGIVDVCRTTYKGIAYDSSLNDGARVNIGLDIINTLSKHYGVQAPIFIDNAESVTEFFVDVDAQLIALNASKEDEVLRVEVTSDQESEVA